MNIKMNLRWSCVCISLLCLLTGCQRGSSDNGISSLSAESKMETTSDTDIVSSEALSGSDEQSTPETPTKMAQAEYDQYLSDRWFDEDGVFRYPFDQQEDVSGWQTEELLGRYKVPEEALKRASTYDLLQVCKDFQLAGFSAYNLPSQFLHYESNVLNAVDELLSRDDLVEILLKDYQNEKYQSVDAQPDAAVEQRIIFDELLLADNAVFDRMTDEQRQLVLEAVLEKKQDRESGKYQSLKVSAFAAYVHEQEAETGSGWYDYIMSNEEQTDFYKMISETDVYAWLPDWSQPH